MNKFFTVFALTALAATLAATSASAATVTGAFTDRGEINGAQVISFDVTTDMALNGLDFTTSGGFGFHGNFNNPGFGDADFNTVLDQFSFAPVLYQPGTIQETYFTFLNDSNLNSAQVMDATPGPSTLLSGAISAASGNLLEVGTTTVAVFSLTDAQGQVLLGNGTAFGLAGLGVTTVGGDTVDIIVEGIPEPATLALFGLGMGGVLLGRRRK